MKEAFPSPWGSGVDLRPIAPPGVVESDPLSVAFPVFSVDLVVFLVVVYSALLAMPGGYLHALVHLSRRAAAPRWDGTERRSSSPRRRIESDWDLFERRATRRDRRSLHAA